MQGARIALALIDAEEMHKMKTFLTVNGFVVVDESQDGTSAIRRIRSLRPDLVIADYELPGLSGIEIARITEEDGIAPTIIVTTYEKVNKWTVSESSQELAYLYRPITKSALLQTIRLVLMNYRRIVRLEQEIDKLKKTLESRKIVEKAKGILMEKMGISEQEAYRRIQKQSMDKGVSMKELARAIIMAYDVEG